MAGTLKIVPAFLSALSVFGVWHITRNTDVADPVFYGALETMGIQPRGIRNNNPGNIERNGIAWQGMAADQSSDSRFVVFESPEYGIRALGKVLDTYYYHHGLHTVAGMVSRYAPGSENDTESYIRSVADRLGVGAEEALSWPGQKAAMVAAIIKHENGLQPYDLAMIDYGISIV